MNEYCQNCVWFDYSRKYCNEHKKYKEKFDTCNAFKRK